MTAVSSALRRAALARARLHIRPQGRLSYFSSPPPPLTGALATPHYSLLFGVGAEDDPVSRCTSGVTDADLQTGQARKDAFRRAAECVADGYCAQYAIPPGVCSSVAGPIAQAIADSADAVGQAFANGFEIQGAAGPTMAEREAWARRALGRAIGATRDIHNALSPSEDAWSRDVQAREVWLAETRDVATLRYAEIYSRPPGPAGYQPICPTSGECEPARRDGAGGMDLDFLVYDYSVNPGNVVQSDIRAGLNAVTRAEVARAAEIRAKKEVLRVDPRFVRNFPVERSALTRGQKVTRVALLGGGLWLLVKILGMIRR